MNEKNLVIYPEKNLTTNIYITGKLSNLKKVTKDDITVYGQISSPIEGNNEIYLKVSTSQRISYDFKKSSYDCDIRKDYQRRSRYKK